MHLSQLLFIWLLGIRFGTELITINNKIDSLLCSHKLSETYLTNSSIALRQQWLVRANKTYSLIQQLLLKVEMLRQTLDHINWNFHVVSARKQWKTLKKLYIYLVISLIYGTIRAAYLWGTKYLTVIFKMRPLSVNVQNVHSMIYQHLCSTLQYRQSNQTFRMISPRKNPNNCESQFVTCKASGTNMYS